MTWQITITGTNPRTTGPPDHVSHAGQGHKDVEAAERAIADGARDFVRDLREGNAALANVTSASFSGTKLTENLLADRPTPDTARH